MKPYGSWDSPITASSLVEGVASITEIKTDNSNIWWSESRPDEGGRVAIISQKNDETPKEITPEGSNVRSRVHEYGGGAWWTHRSSLFYVEFDDQRVRKK